MKYLGLIIVFALGLFLVDSCSFGPSNNLVDVSSSSTANPTPTQTSSPTAPKTGVPSVTLTEVEVTLTPSATTVPNPTSTATFLATATEVLNTPTVMASPTFTPTPLPATPSPAPTAALAPITQLELVESDKVWGVAWSPDGKIVAVANSKTIWLYDLTNPLTPPRALRGHNHLIQDLAFSPDGTSLAATDQGRKLYLWDITTETGIAILDNPNLTSRRSLAFSPDGATLAVGNSLSNGGFVQLIDPHTHTEKTVIDKGAWLFAVALSNDYVGIISGGEHSSGLSLLNLHTGASLPIDNCGLLFPTSVTDIGSIAFSPDGTLFAAGLLAGNYAGTTGAVRLWDLKQGVCRGSLPRYRYIYYLAFSPDGLLLATSDGRSIRLWNSQTLNEVMVIYPQVSQTNFFSSKGRLFAFSPDSSRLAFVDGNTLQLLALPPDLATQPHPSALKRELLIVDDFTAYTEAQLQTSYGINNAGGANQGSLRLVEQEGIPMMALDYVINQSRPNNYVMAERCFMPEQNWQNARFLEISVENDEQPKTLIVQFGEGRRCAGEPFNGEVWRTTVYLPEGTKSLINLPIDDKLFFTRASWSSQQNSQFDLEKIGYFAVGFESLVGPSSGTVYIGSARLWP